MKVDVRNVPRDGEALACSVPAGAVGEVRPGVRTSGTIELSCVARRLDDTALAQGTARGVCLMSCSRCLVEFERRFDVSVEGAFATRDVRDGSEEEHSGTGEDSYVYDGLEIDVVPMVRDDLIFNVSAKPLCSTGCKGLCPACGADLNRGSCSCERDEVDPRLAVLKDMFPCDED